jgi:hypothetical protein
MKKVKRRRLALIITISLLLALTACSYPPSSNEGSKIDSNFVQFDPDLPTATLLGVVVDAEITEFGIMNFFEYEEALTAEIKYSGAKVAIYQAVEAGTTKMGEGFPELINYNKGNKVAELLTDDNGIFLIELPPGVYFVAVFYSVSSYSGDLVIELDENGEQIGIGLIHGI